MRTESPDEKRSRKRNSYSHLKNRTWRLIDNRQEGKKPKCMSCSFKTACTLEPPCPMCQSLFPSLKGPARLPPISFSSLQSLVWLHPLWCFALYIFRHLLCCPWELAHFAFLTVSLELPQALEDYTGLWMGLPRLASTAPTFFSEYFFGDNLSSLARKLHAYFICERVKKSHNKNQMVEGWCLMNGRDVRDIWWSYM